MRQQFPSDGRTPAYASGLWLLDALALHRSIHAVGITRIVNAGGQRLATESLRSATAEAGDNLFALNR
jgi:hypothetical protein